MSLQKMLTLDAHRSGSGASSCSMSNSMSKPSGADGYCLIQTVTGARPEGKARHSSAINFKLAVFVSCIG